MQHTSNPFDVSVGSGKLGTPKYIVLILVIIVISAFLIVTQGPEIGFGLMALPFILLYFYWLFKNPIIGLYTAIGLGFILLGITRYFKSLGQVGMAMDGILFLTYIALLFKKFREKIDWTPAKKDITQRQHLQTKSGSLVDCVCSGWKACRLCGFGPLDQVDRYRLFM